MSYIDQHIYKLAYQSSLRVHYLIDSTEDLGMQVKRASRAVAVTIAKVYNKCNPDLEGFTLLEEAARGVDEVTVLLSFCNDLDVIDSQAAAGLVADYAELTKAIQDICLRPIDQPN